MNQESENIYYIEKVKNKIFIKILYKNVSKEYITWLNYVWYWEIEFIEINVLSRIES